MRHLNIILKDILTELNNKMFIKIVDFWELIMKFAIIFIKSVFLLNFKITIKRLKNLLTFFNYEVYNKTITLAKKVFFMLKFKITINFFFD
jgi:hypothetical protein